MSYLPTVTIRAATRDDASDVAQLLAQAFLHGDLAPWLIPHLDTRARVYRPYFALLTEQALDHGQVHITADTSAVAVWYPIAGGPPPEAGGYPTRLAQVTGQFLHRFSALHDAMHRHHPYDAWHHYLAFLAVHPDHQQQGLGTALLNHHHTDLDHSGTPAYLEATGSRNARLYARHGYQQRTSFPIARHAPMLHPMWRPSAA